MTAKQLARLLPWVVGLGFCVVEIFKIFFLIDSKPAPEGDHSDAAMFAPAVSTNWRYITESQTVILIVVTSVVLLLAAAMVYVQWRSRETPETDETQTQASRPAVRGGVFGRRDPDKMA
jgi:hypothetical protein